MNTEYTGVIDKQSIQHAPDQLRTHRLILIVTGAHLRAEAYDRPLAYRLRLRMLEWRDRRIEKEEALADFDVVVCSDIWRLNNESLAAQPTVSVGEPGVNALSAYLADKTPSAYVIDDTLMVQLDLDFTDVIACCWGVNGQATEAAVDAFIERYLDDFLTAASDRIDDLCESAGADDGGA